MSSVCVGLVNRVFFKQKTAYEMRISDWSSDVCSSDLLLGRVALLSDRRPEWRHRTTIFQISSIDLCDFSTSPFRVHVGDTHRARSPAPDRQSVVSGKSVSVRVDFGGRRLIKKKNSQRQTIVFIILIT